MLINLYGNIVNPKTIMRVTLSTSSDGYYIYFNNTISISTTDSNVLEIQSSTVQTVDELTFHDPSEIYMQNMINQLESLAKPSAKEINTNDNGQTVKV